MIARSDRCHPLQPDRHLPAHGLNPGSSYGPLTQQGCFLCRRHSSALSRLDARTHLPRSHHRSRECTPHTLDSEARECCPCGIRTVCSDLAGSRQVPCCPKQTTSNGTKGCTKKCRAQPQRGGHRPAGQECVQPRHAGARKQPRSCTTRRPGSPTQQEDPVPGAQSLGAARERSWRWRRGHRLQLIRRPRKRRPLRVCSRRSAMQYSQQWLLLSRHLLPRSLASASSMVPIAYSPSGDGNLVPRPTKQPFPPNPRRASEAEYDRGDIRTCYSCSTSRRPALLQVGCSQAHQG